MTNEKIIILDFGGQYCQLIARRVREARVYCEIVPHDAPIERIKTEGLKGIIFTGGPDSVYDDNAPKCSAAVFDLDVPILGICYGMQLLAYEMGGTVSPMPKSEFGRTEMTLNQDGLLHPLCAGFLSSTVVWMNHTDAVITPPAGFTVLGQTEHCACAMMAYDVKKRYAVQFHPEVHHTVMGTKLLHNFLFAICACSGDWQMGNFSEKLIADIREKAAGKKVLSALSGGVDSSVASVLVHKAVGDQLTCIFVDHGLLRQDEAEEVMRFYNESLGLKIIKVDAQERFLNKLLGVTDPERKRKIIGEEFIRVFEEEAKKIGAVDFLVQGTIYPDVIESGGSKKAAVIKSHHNVGGLPDNIEFKELIEPLRLLFKDEVRALGETLGIPHHLVWRQPFPGPGLAVRVLGEITSEKLRMVRESDFIFRSEIAAAGLAEQIWQYFTVFPNVRTVGVMGDGRTYDNLIAIRAVTSTDAMTVEFAEIPYPILRRISERIVNEVDGVNRVVYDITSKPPGTIEWE